MRTTLLALAAALASAAPAQPASPSDLDSDGDGISDFREIHKHLTDPNDPDSDGDGVPDGDWLERREFAYTVRAVMHVIKPLNVHTLTDDYQDGRLLDDQPDHAEIEVILYPFNTVAEGVSGSKRWGTGDRSLARYLAPGVTTNWDESLVADLHAELRNAGIDVTELTDAEAAAAIADHLMSRINSEDSFTTFAVDFTADGDLVIPPELRPHWESELARRNRTLEEQLDHELYGKGMFDNRTMGSCTSAAIYLATAIKAAGIPARSIICVPVTDGNDDAELALAERLTNHRVRQIVTRAHKRSKNTWTSHTFNEVHVGGRWVRLNYDRLGQGILDEQFLGLMVHVNTYADHAEAGLAAWGRRNRSDRDDVCGFANPYSCISLTDRFGPHCTLDNPPVEPALAHLTIEHAYWYDQQGDEPRLETTLQNPDTAGHLFVVVAEEASFDEYNEFYTEAGKAFSLVADGRDPIPAHAARGFWINPDSGLRDFYIYVPPEHFAKIAPGIEYRLVPHDTGLPVEWRVSDRVRVTRPAR